MLLLLVVCSGVATGGYFVYDTFFKSLALENEPLKLGTVKKVPVAKASLINFQDNIFTDTKKGNVSYIRCSLETNKKTVYCSQIMIDYDGTEEATINLTFNNVIEYFANCFLQGNQGERVEPTICSNTDSDEWYTTDVLPKFANFTKTLLSSFSYGPEITLLNSVVFSRGYTVNPNSNPDYKFSSFNNKIISVYVSDKSTPEDINTEYYNAIYSNTHSSTTNSKNKVRSINSLINSFLFSYGKHAASFNTYIGRNTRLGVNDDQNPNKKLIDDLKEVFILAISKRDDPQYVQRFGYYTKFKDVLDIAHKNVNDITEPEIETVINNLKYIYFGSSISTTQKNISQVFPAAIQNQFFASCDLPSKSFRPLLMNEIGNISPESNPAEKAAFLLKLKDFFSIDSLLAMIYSSITVKNINGQVGCANLMLEEYNFVNFYGTFLLFGIDLYESIAITEKFANLVSNNV